MTDVLQNPLPAFKDRTLFLRVCGVVEIVLGVLAGGLAVLLLLAQALARSAMPGAPQYNWYTMAPGLFFYTVIAVALIWLGIGSLMARRWARALLLTLSALALAAGIMIFPAMLIVMSQMHAFTPPGAPEMSPGLMTGVKAIMMMVVFFVYIFVPGLFVLAYRGKDVKATCEWRDPKVRWTDKCPLPVLALSILCAFGGLCTILCAGVMPVFPLLDGTLLTGFTAGAVLVVLGGIYASLAWGTFKLNETAWWGLLALMALCSLYGSLLLGMGRIDWVAYYRAAGFVPEQIDMIQASGAVQVMNSGTAYILAALYGCVYLGYLLYVKRFFAKPLPQ